MWGTAMAADVLTRVRAEIDARLRELRSAVVEYERLLAAADAIEEEARERSAAEPEPADEPVASRKPKAAAKRRVPAAPPAAKLGAAKLGAAEQAIVAALEHGSHTVGELGVVTAMSGAEIREGARRLLRAGRIVRAKREGRAAYALADAA
jgi:hypothetical protein